MGWQKATGYSRRNLVETATGRYKHLIGSTLRARRLAAQQGEVAMAVRALNRMIDVAKPLSVRVTQCIGFVDIRAISTISTASMQQRPEMHVIPGVSSDGSSTITPCSNGLAGRGFRRRGVAEARQLLLTRSAVAVRLF